MSIIEQRDDQRSYEPSITTIQPTAAGWFDDPRAQHRLRYFDGDTWTDHVTHYGPTPCKGCG